MLAPEALALRMSRAAAAVAAIVAGLAAGVVGAAAYERLGTAFVLGSIALAAAWWLVSRPLACVASLVVLTIALESDLGGAFPITARWYRSFLGGALTPTDLLIAVTVVAVVVDHYRRPQTFRAPSRFVLPLALLVAATLAGITTGSVAGADPILLLNSARVLAYLVVIAFLVAHVLSSGVQVRGAIVLVTALTAAKSALGLVAVAFGQGRRVGVESGDAGSVLTYYAPTMNFLAMLVILGVLAMAVARKPLPRWVHAGAVVCLLSLLFSYRRSFWIALVIAAVIVGVVASGRRGRFVMVATVAVVAGGLFYTLSSGGATESENAVSERVRSLNPEEIEARPQDRYRLDEQKNVFAEIQRRPLTGLGFGIPWEARHPMSEEHPGGRDYTHTTVLWFWLKTGPLGLAGYLTLHAVSILSGYRLWRRSVDALVRSAGLAIAAGVVGLAVAETTGSFTGVDARLTIVIAAMCAWLGAAEEVTEEERSTVGAGA